MAPPARRLPALAQYRSDAVTRHLCAGAHLDEGVARVVDGVVTGVRGRAPPRSHGLAQRAPGPPP
ncbi:hypothetical protein ACFXA3_42630, partial [Streptomyces sp. NPDC059456]|uniref:hypothetical protein n=1 Tax=Streptomyces sp. NPDC059456 TaxID=3346838 RepID=UPI0036827B8E